MKKNKNKNAHSERILHHYAQVLDQGQKIGDSGGSGVTFFFSENQSGRKGFVSRYFWRKIRPDLQSFDFKDLKPSKYC